MQSTHGYAEERQGKRVISNNLHVFSDGAEVQSSIYTETQNLKR